jgi:hypothetical protein
MDLYPWRFDSIHSHCHDDVNSILNILKNFPCCEVSCVVTQKSGTSGNPPSMMHTDWGVQCGKDSIGFHLQRKEAKRFDTLISWCSFNSTILRECPSPRLSWLSCLQVAWIAGFLLLQMHQYVSAQWCARNPGVTRYTCFTLNEWTTLIYLLELWSNLK